MSQDAMLLLYNFFVQQVINEVRVLEFDSTQYAECSKVSICRSLCSLYLVNLAVAVS